jgi:acetyl esterase/lipase
MKDFVMDSTGNQWMFAKFSAQAVANLQRMRRRTKGWLVLALLPAIMIPATTAAQDATNLPAEPSAPAVALMTGARVHKDIQYATVGETSLMCDVYVPNPPEPAKTTNAAGENSETDRRPAVLLVHGGGWASGDKWTVGSFARALAEKGVVAVSINYRHAPAHKFPAQVDDVRAALVWLVDHADDYNVDVDRIGMFGYSAGGHLSCMIGTLADAPWETVRATTAWDQSDPRWKKIPKVCGVVGGGTPCDFRTLPIDNTAVAYFLGGSRRECPETYRAASPAEHASAGDAPTLFIHGTTDLIVPIASSRVLYDAQVKAGVPSRFLAIEGPGHMLTFINPKTQSATIEFLCELLFPMSKNAATE